MRKTGQEVTDKDRPTATLATGLWRKFGILGLLGLLVAATAMASPPQSAPVFTSLVNFNGTNGAYPIGGMVQGANGNLYGATSFGGTMGAGNLFRLTQDGTLTSFYNFCSEANCTDGVVPPGGLVMGTDGNFYGTTATGGGTLGSGTVFKITPGGTLTTIYNWCSQPNCTDGTYFSLSGNTLIQAADGNFYGTNNGGGTGTAGCFFGDGGCGTVFKLTPSGTLTTLYNWCSQPNCADGQFPGNLIQGTDGNFYGTTTYGGANSGGTIFKITPGGALTTLYQFCSQPNCADGGNPGAGLVQASDGNFYGTTGGGGASYGGTVFKLTPNGTLTTLYSFCSQANCADGGDPAGPVLGSDGIFYGTTAFGGPTGGGTFFQVTPNGVLTTLYSFCTQVKCTDGSGPGTGPSTLAQGTNGIFYGVTDGYPAPANPNGTIFSLDVGLGPFVETVPGSGKAGDTVTILGTGLTNATHISFNHKQGAFTVVSDSEIQAAVPSAATTGFVTVNMHGSQLQSNVPFQVVP